MSKNVIALGMSNALAVKLNNYGEPEIVRDHKENLDRIECVVFPNSGSNGYLVGKSARVDCIDAPESMREFFTDGKDEDSKKCLDVLFQYILEFTRLSGEDFSESLICCPSYFQQDVIRDAANSAGISADANCLKFISEAEAVLAYCRKEPTLQHSTVLVCDLGGSRLDLYLLQVDDLFNAIDEGFSNYDLGGRQWTNAMKALLLDKIVEETGFTVDELDEETLWDIGNKAEIVKERLSTKNTTQIKIRIYDEQYRLILNRKEFDEYAGKYVDVMYQDIEDYTSKAKIEFDHILLLGGSSKMPMVRNVLEKIYPDKKVIYDDGCILAYGAVYAANS